ncbi:hypothetical protein [Dactylosporangium sp. NPDC051484]|uniref:hypothetical protein n=1 Tax=Dactylosporangium sp. NPDC051484 TaxID=3154942 RepID=UPI00344B9781
MRANTRTGKITRKFIRESELAKGVGYTCDLVHYHRGDEVFTAPQHRHDFDQIRLTIEGTTDYGHLQVAEPGDVAFFPAGAYYGPERFEEAEIFLIQWSKTWITREQNDAAYKALSEKGTFKDGFYVTTDENGNEVRKDGANAVFEAIYQRPMVIPKPKYATPIIMHSDAYEWQPAGENAEVKDLGHFTEGDIGVTTHQWEAGGTIDLTPERTFIVWVSSGSVEIDGRTVGARTLIFSDATETHQLVGVEAGTATILRMPISQ